MQGTTIHVPSDYLTIQLAIDAAVNGDTVLVERGRYYENINFKGKKIVLASQYVLTGNTDDIDSTIIDGSQAANPDTASVVLFITSEDPSSVLYGFTITGGTGTITNDELSPSTRFRRGGGIFCSLTSPTITHNVIVGNMATNSLGVISAGGGGIRCGGGTPRILNNVIMYNQAKYGGGLLIQSSGTLIKNNVIYRNSGGEDFGGGGIWIAGNSSNPKLIENNTIIENSVPKNSGGGIFIQSATATMRNNIIWGNSAQSEPQIAIAGASFSVSYSDVQGGWTGTGNINQYPKFTDTSHYLLPSSPCIDAGNPSSVYNDPEDTLNPGTALFPSMGTVRNDMGAYGGAYSSPSAYYDDHASDPLPPSGISAYSDYSTPTTIHIQWNDPMKRRDSTLLTNFEIHIYRDYVLVAVVDTGIQSYDDIGLVNHQRYVYMLLTSSGSDSSISDSVAIIAGGSAYPQSPSQFSVRDRADGISLTWKNPSRQTDGTPLNDLAYVLLYRDDILFDSISQTSSDTGLVKSYLDSISGYHQYRVAVRDNEVPSHNSTSTSSALGYGGLTNSYSNDFESGLGSVYKVGPWDTTSQLAHIGIRSLTDSPGGNYATLEVFYIYMSPVILQSSTVLRFDHIGIVRPTGSVLVDISRNQRKTFSAMRTYNWNSYPQWQDGTADSTDWKFEHIDLSANAGDTATIRFRILTGAFPADGWYIDNVFIGPASVPTTMQQDLSAGWNLVSLPLQTTEHDIKNLYSSVETHGFAYAGKYVERDTMLEGIGYWLKFPFDHQANINGMTLVKNTINVVKGWNIIGGLSSPLAASSIISSGTTVTSEYISYSATSGYAAQDTLMPGMGYWVKVNAAGQLILRTDSVLIQPKTLAGNSDEDNRRATRLSFRDARGQVGALYFSTHSSGNQLAKYDLPPLPPGDVMDVRFASNRLLEVPDYSEQKIVTIRLTSIVEPLTISWDAVDNTCKAALVIDNDTISLDGRTHITLQHVPQIVQLLLPASSREALPTSFALGQNYPNPFNPVTTIRYQLPVPARVTITLYNVVGQKIQILRDDVEEAGFKEMEWNASSMPSGVYFYRLEAVGTNTTHDSFADTKKMLLLK